MHSPWQSLTIARLPADDLQDWFRHWDVVFPPASIGSSSILSRISQRASFAALMSLTIVLGLCRWEAVHVHLQETLRKPGTSESIVPPRASNPSVQDTDVDLHRG